MLMAGVLSVIQRRYITKSAVSCDSKKGFQQIRTISVTLVKWQDSARHDS